MHVHRKFLLVTHVGNSSFDSMVDDDTVALDFDEDEGDDDIM